jgi:hypothetical protein
MIGFVAMAYLVGLKLIPFISKKIRRDDKDEV